ncbi:hypothetical protein POM88_006022 [Heracleum sosnowskyi]|uniref:Uncharacterized protein n=1 Tax=Heracleum sosnowskyi TaxID=360622 RepID=A0AAD8J1X0_9APIA|nr:hypothetical protein POM88_006022 [Heracleum sosnowskyi]
MAKGKPFIIYVVRLFLQSLTGKGSRLSERKFYEKVQHLMYYGSHIVDAESDRNSIPRFYDNSSILKKQEGPDRILELSHVMEEHERLLEFERMCFSEMQLAAKFMNHHPYFGYAPSEMKLSEAHEEQPDFPSAERFNYFTRGLNLPDSSFAVIVLPSKRRKEVVVQAGIKAKKRDVGVSAGLRKKFTNIQLDFINLFDQYSARLHKFV